MTECVRDTELVLGRDHPKTAFCDMRHHLRFTSVAYQHWQAYLTSSTRSALCFAQGESVNGSHLDAKKVLGLATAGELDALHEYTRSS